MAKGKLHEILAVEKAREEGATLATKEAIELFEGKQINLLGFKKTYTPFDDEEKEHLSESETHELVTTVGKKLAYVFGERVNAWLDVVLQKEATNQTARADVVIDGKVLLKDMPATYLLWLEKRAEKWRKMVNAIPTLTPGILWQKDPSRGEGVYIAPEPEIGFRTKNTIMHKVLVEPTEFHPAQIEKWSEKIKVGRTEKHTWCGMLSPADKAEILKRIDKFFVATKQARMRANHAEIVKLKVGKDIENYILKGEFPPQASS